MIGFNRFVVGQLNTHSIQMIVCVSMQKKSVRIVYFVDKTDESSSIQLHAYLLSQKKEHKQLFDSASLLLSSGSVCCGGAFFSQPICWRATTDTGARPIHLCAEHGPLIFVVRSSDQWAISFTYSSEWFKSFFFRHLDRKTTAITADLIAIYGIECDPTPEFFTTKNASHCHVIYTNKSANVYVRVYRWRCLTDICFQPFGQPFFRHHSQLIDKM